MITMALGGLWHGASWTFVLWGVLHGFLLIGHRFFSAACARTSLLGRLLESRLGTMLRILLTYLAVCACWVFFRATKVEDALMIFWHLVRLEGLEAPLVYHCLVVLIGAIGAAYALSALGVWKRIAYRTPAPLWGLSNAVLLTLSMALAPEANQLFIYFQF